MERSEERLRELYQFIKGESDPEKVLEEAYQEEVEDSIYRDLRKERQWQDHKWGNQSHPDGTGDDYYLAMQELAKQTMDPVNPEWSKILLEEVYEALSETNEELLSRELVQVAAVCIAWLKDIKTRHIQPENIVAETTIEEGEEEL